MKKIRIIALLISLLLSCSIIAQAASFPDVNESVSWAKVYIDDMASKGYLKGYEDGTFRPLRLVSKQEAIILIARILGVDSAENATTVEYANAQFASTLRAYSTSYKKEVAFLLYNDVLKTNDLITYVADNMIEVPLKRYEAAELLTKVMGAETEVKNQLMIVSSFKDAVQIPSSAKGFVEYVKETGVMQGVGIDTESGKPIFDPLTEVNRAQMATMLSKILPVLDVKNKHGKVTAVDTENKKLTVLDQNNISTDFTMANNTVYKFLGSDVTFDKFAVNNEVSVQMIRGTPRVVQGLTEVFEQFVEGTLTTRELSPQGTKITITTPAGNKSAYIMSEDVMVYSKGVKTMTSALKIDDYVKLTIKAGRVSEIDIVNKYVDITGTIENIAMDNDCIITVKLTNGKTEDYITAPTSVQVGRNGLNSDLRSLAVGDKITARLEFNKIIKITATSTSQTLEGTIVEVNISKNPYIKVKVFEEIKTYNLSAGLVIKVDGEPGTTYDLRVDMPIKIKTESQSLVEIEVTSVVKKVNITGSVELVHPSYGFIKIQTIDTSGTIVIEEVFVKPRANIFDNSTGKTKTLNDIKKGMTVTAIGSNLTGVFEANTIIIVD